MKLTVLGSGTTVPHPKRTSSAYWLDTSAGPVLLDCSASVQSRIAAAGLNWPDLTSIWISHFHLDHVGGLAPVLAGTKHAEEMKSRETPLKIFGPVGLKGIVERFDGVNNYRLLEQPFPVEIIEVEPLEEFYLADGVTAVAKKTPHTAESLAVHIRDGEKTLVYTGDTAFDETLASFANRVDLLLIECSYVGDKPKKKHLELAEVMHIVRKAGPGRTVLTHLYPEWDRVDLNEELGRFETAAVVLPAFDGMIVEI
jgi:ribonuclease Z